MRSPLNTNSVVRQIETKSAVNSSLWACVAISNLCFFLSSKTSGWFSVAIFLVGLAPVISFIYSYFYFLFKNPDYLRSENYQLKMETIRLLGDKDNGLEASAKDLLHVTTNPKLERSKK